MCEELRHIEMSRCIMHRGETEKKLPTTYKGHEVASNAINTLSEQKQGKRQCYPQKS